MRNICLFITAMFIFSCKGKGKCTFSTAKDLEQANFSKCPPDSMFRYMKKFSLAFNDIRKEKDIPLLPTTFIAEVYTVDNQVRWHNDEIMNNDFKETPGKAYMNWKDVEWAADTLKYDRTAFSSGDSLKSGLTVVYWLDTLTTRRDYRFRYSYHNKNYEGDSTLDLTKAQADSVLRVWKLEK